MTTDETSIDELLTRVHPDDVQAARTSLAASLNPADPKHVMIEYRVQRRNGEIRWVEIHERASFEGIGREKRAVSLIGTGAR